MTITFTSDIDHKVNMLKRLSENGGYCPCKLVKNEDTKCMCKEFRDMIEGACSCGLYIKYKD